MRVCWDPIVSQKKILRETLNDIHITAYSCIPSIQCYATCQLFSDQVIPDPTVTVLWIRLWGLMNNHKEKVCVTLRNHFTIALTFPAKLGIRASLSRSEVLLSLPTRNVTADWRTSNTSSSRQSSPGPRIIPEGPLDKSWLQRSGLALTCECVFLTAGGIVETAAQEAC